MQYVAGGKKAHVRERILHSERGMLTQKHTRVNVVDVLGYLNPYDRRTRSLSYHIAEDPSRRNRLDQS